MARRKPTARVQVPVRMLEAMRAKLEKSAKARGVSLNGEIVGRLQQSLTGAESLLTDLLGSREKLLFAMAVADIIQEAEQETGSGWRSANCAALLGMTCLPTRVRRLMTMGPFKLMVAGLLPRKVTMLTTRASAGLFNSRKAASSSDMSGR